MLNTENGASTDRLKVHNPTMLTSCSKICELHFPGVCSNEVQLISHLTRQNNQRQLQQ
jgi:hypothetical protein